MQLRARQYLARLKHIPHNAKITRVYDKYKGRTMIPLTTYVNNLLLAYGLRDVPGCVVECGVWRGGMIAGLAEILGPEREYFLIDSFEGLPPVEPVDGPSAAAWQARTQSPTYYDNCRATAAEALATMQESPAPKVNLIKGWFEDTLPMFTAPGGIALLRLDGDWYQSTRICLRELVPQVNPKGIIIVDDYYTWDGCARAVHEFLAQEKSGRRIRQFANDVCVLGN